MHFQARGQFFTIRTDLKPVNNIFTLSAVKRLSGGSVYATLSLNWLTRVPSVYKTIRKKSKEQTSEY